MNVIDKVFGISPSVLALRSQRTEMISANLANADTPGYKAKDIDFQAALGRATGDYELLQTNKAHMKQIVSMGHLWRTRFAIRPVLISLVPESNPHCRHCVESDYESV